METDFTFTGSYRVYFKDTDTGGVMYHARYVEFLEMSRTDFFHHHGHSIRRLLEEQQLVFPVIELSCWYLRPAYLDDILRVELRMEKISGAKIFFSYKIFNQKNELLSKATTINAVVDIHKQRPVRADKVLPDLAALGKQSGLKDITA